MSHYATLELSLRHWSGDEYRAETRFRQSASAADAQLIVGDPVIVKLDPEALRAKQLDITAYGRLLGAMLFADTRLQSALVSANTQAETQGIPLRLILRMPPEDTTLQGIAWECLESPGNAGPITHSERVLFSRYLDSPDMGVVQLKPYHKLRSLVVIASPSGLDRYNLGAINAQVELEQARQALAGTQISVLASAIGEEAASVPAILSQLREGFDVLYLVAHGTLRNGEPVVWLEDDHGKIERVSASDLTQQISQLADRPLLVVLVSCASAGAPQEDPLNAIGPRLVRAGIPAVLAMQGNLSMKTAAQFLPVFFRELRRDGQIDRACAAARGAVRNRYDWWVPALYMRVRDGRIWSMVNADHDIDAQISAYTGALTRWCNDAPYLSLAPVGSPPDIEQIFIPLLVTQDLTQMEQVAPDMPWASGRYRTFTISRAMHITRELSERRSKLRFDRIMSFYQSRSDSGQSNFNNSPPSAMGSQSSGSIFDKHLLLTGEAGAGKSTLLRYMAIHAWRDPQLIGLQAPHLPLIVSLRHFVETSGTLEERLIAALGAESLPAHLLPKGFLDSWPHHTGAHWLLLFDALDEVPFEQRNVLLRDLSRLLNDGSASDRIIITSRPGVLGIEDLLSEAVPGSDRKEKKLIEYQLRAFDQSQINDFAQRWFSTNADAFLEELERINAGWSLDSPLLLTIAAIVFARNEQLPARTSGLYETFVQIWLNEAEKRGLHTALNKINPRLPKFTRLILENLALQGVEQEVKTSYAQVKGVAAYLQTALGLSRDEALLDAQAFLSEVAVYSGLFVRRGERGEFVHATVRDYLAAVALVRRWSWEPDPYAAASKYLLDNWSSDPASFISGLLSDGIYTEKRSLDKVFEPLLKRHRGKVRWGAINFISRAIAEQVSVSENLRVRVLNRLLRGVRHTEVLDGLIYFPGNERVINTLKRLAKRHLIRGWHQIYIAEALVRLGEVDAGARIFSKIAHSPWVKLTLRRLASQSLQLLGFNDEARAAIIAIVRSQTISLPGSLTIIWGDSLPWRASLLSRNGFLWIDSFLSEFSDINRLVELQAIDEAIRLCRLLLSPKTIMLDKFNPSTMLEYMDELLNTASELDVAIILSDFLRRAHDLERFENDMLLSHIERIMPVLSDLHARHDLGTSLASYIRYANRAEYFLVIDNWPKRACLILISLGHFDAVWNFMAVPIYQKRIREAAASALIDVTDKSTLIAFLQFSLSLPDNKDRGSLESHIAQPLQLAHAALQRYEIKKQSAFDDLEYMEYDYKKRTSSRNRYAHRLTRLFKHKPQMIGQKDDYSRILFTIVKLLAVRLLDQLGQKEEAASILTSLYDPQPRILLSDTQLLVPQMIESLGYTDVIIKSVRSHFKERLFIFLRSSYFERNFFSPPYPSTKEHTDMLFPALAILFRLKESMALTVISNDKTIRMDYRCMAMNYLVKLGLQKNAMRILSKIILDPQVGSQERIYLAEELSQIGWRTQAILVLLTVVAQSKNYDSEVIPYFHSLNAAPILARFIVKKHVSEQVYGAAVRIIDSFDQSVTLSAFCSLRDDPTMPTELRQKADEHMKRLTNFSQLKRLLGLDL